MDTLLGVVFSHIFSKDHLKDPPGLLEKLQQPQDLLSTHIRHNLSSTACASLDACEVSNPLSESAQKTLIKELNILLRNPSLYDSDTFQEVSLSHATRELINKKPGRWKCIHLNRLLLEQVFPSEIYKSYTVNWYEFLLIWAILIIGLVIGFKLDPQELHVPGLKVLATAIMALFGVIATFVDFRSKTDEGYTKRSIHSFRAHLSVAFFVIAFFLIYFADKTAETEEEARHTELKNHVTEKTRDVTDSTNMSTKELMEMIKAGSYKLVDTQKKLQMLIDTSIRANATGLRDLINKKDETQAERLQKRVAEMVKTIYTLSEQIAQREKAAAQRDTQLSEQIAQREKAAAQRDTQLMKYINGQVQESSKTLLDFIEEVKLRNSKIEQDQNKALENISQLLKQLSVRDTIILKYIEGLNKE